MFLLYYRNMSDDLFQQFGACVRRNKSSKNNVYL